MELKLKDGNYVAGAEGIATVGGLEELMQRIAMKLTARRGKFGPMPDYGSRLYTLLSSGASTEPEAQIRAFIAEALSDEPAVTLGSVSLRAEGEVLHLNTVFQYTGGSFAVETEIRE